MHWDYDFGDGWSHNVLVEAILPAEPDLDYPRCITGKRACPPEDCGGPWAYMSILKALRDRNYPGREDLLEVVPSGYDPAAFSVENAQAALRAPHPLEGW